MANPKILAFAGSERSESLNRRLLKHVVGLLQKRNADVNHVELADYTMPIYNGDLEEAEGLPDTVLQMKDHFKRADGLLIAVPEYNGSITPLLKNVIDWVSRKGDDASPLECYRGKVAGLVAASPGSLGGMRAMGHVRTILSGIGTHVIPTQVAVAKAHEAFDRDINLTNERYAQMLATFADELVKTVSALSR